MPSSPNDQRVARAVQVVGTHARRSKLTDDTMDDLVHDVLVDLLLLSHVLGTPIDLAADEAQRTVRNMTVDEGGLPEIVGGATMPYAEWGTKPHAPRSVQILAALAEIEKTIATATPEEFPRLDELRTTLTAELAQHGEVGDDA
jgi:hypothetical protein